MPTFDPKDRVNIEKVEKRGEHYTIEGTAEGRRVEAHIPAPTMEERRSLAETQALMRRVLLGTKRMADRGEDDAKS